MKIMTKPLPDITNIPSGLKDASNVELLGTGCTLYVDNCRKYQSKCRANLVTTVIQMLLEFKDGNNSQACHGKNQAHEYAHP